MKRLTFNAPSYTRTLLHSYDYVVPTISNTKYLFKEFINKKKDSVERTLDVDSYIDYSKHDAQVKFSPMFTENWGHNKLETTIVLGNFEQIEIWLKANVVCHSPQIKYRELSSLTRLVDTIKIKDPNKYNSDLFTIECGNQLGQELLNKQDQIEDMIHQHQLLIEMSFTTLLNKLLDIKKILLRGIS